MKNNYVIINSDTIQKKIEELNKTFKIKSEEKQALKKLVYSDNADEILLLGTEMYGLEVSIEELQNILSLSISLNEELEKAYTSGFYLDRNETDIDERKEFKQEYLPNLKLSI